MMPDGFFSVIPTIVTLGFIFVFVMIGITLFRNAATSIHNSSMPQETVPARIIAKRQHVWGGGHDTHSSTSYYMTFELADGSRLELPVNGKFYGLNTEGDTGMLTHQGTRFFNFEREQI